MRHVLSFFSLLRFLPILVFYNYYRKCTRLTMDMERWCDILKIQGNYCCKLLFLLSKYKEFRNLFIYRIRGNMFLKALTKILYKPMETLYIETPEIGGGMFIHHGFATIIAAQNIGENFWVNQQVTIGHKDDKGCPTIGDNVMVTAGAKIIGPVYIGDNVVVGANAVVVKDISSNHIVGGIPAKFIKINDKYYKKN